MKLNGDLDAADLVKHIADPAITADERDMAQHMFLSELDRIADNRIALAMDDQMTTAWALEIACERIASIYQEGSSGRTAAEWRKDFMRQAELRSKS